MTTCPLELTATPRTSPKFMSGEIFRKSTDESNGIVGTLRRGVWADTLASTAMRAHDVVKMCFTIDLLRSECIIIPSDYFFASHIVPVNGDRRVGRPSPADAETARPGRARQN